MANNTILNTTNNRYINKYTVCATLKLGSALTFTNNEVDLTADSIRIPNHGYRLGDACALTTAGTLPTGLAIDTAYYVVIVDNSTIKLATSRANAIAGTVIDITAIAGSNTAAHTLTINAMGTIKTGAVIPKNHVIVNSMYVITTSLTATTTAGTVAIQALAANDIVSAAAISTNVWTKSTANPILGVPVYGTASTCIVMTSDSEVQFVIGTKALTAGEINVYLDVLACE